MIDLAMEGVSTSETSVCFHETTLRNISDDSPIYSFVYLNLYKFLIV
jgi:hypothetical protein